MSDYMYKYLIVPYLLGSYPHKETTDPLGKPVPPDPRWAVERYRRLGQNHYVLSGKRIFKDKDEARDYLRSQEALNYLAKEPTGVQLPERKPL
jgi:hypothetical protein